MSTRWDEPDIPELAGKVAMVTGANSGLGLHTATMLARHGAKVLMACRNLRRAEDAARQVRFTATDDVEIVAVDLGSLASVAAGAEKVVATEKRLDILVNNAGLMAVDRARTEDGFEVQFGVNHLGHFALTARLMPLLLSTPASRVVTVSSMGHRLGTLDLDDLFFERRRYDRWRPYFQSKLANLLFTAELQRRLSEARRSTLALAAHPGASSTDLGHEGSGVTNVAMRAGSVLAQPARIGALATVRAATDPSARGGAFYGPQFLLAGYPRVEVPSRAARDVGDARRLWTRSEELTGVSLEIASIE